MQTANIGDYVMHYRIDGPWDDETATGPVVVFSNSLGTDLRVWDPLMPHLPADWRIVRYDTAGHGLSGAPGVRSIGQHARDLRALLSLIGVEKATIVGLSVGGLIAQALWAADPGMVEALVLCDTAPKIGNDELWNERIETARSSGIEPLADAVMARWFSAEFRRSRPDDLAIWRNMLVRTPADGYAALSEAIRDADFTASSAKIDKPTLCVVGDEDGATPPDLVRAMSELIPGAAFFEISGAGHLPCVEAPEVLATRIRAFMEENGIG